MNKPLREWLVHGTPDPDAGPMVPKAFRFNCRADAIEYAVLRMRNTPRERRPQIRITRTMRRDEYEPEYVLPVPEIPAVPGKKGSGKDKDGKIKTPDVPTIPAVPGVPGYWRMSVIK